MTGSESPAVSVIIPAYGHASYILEALQSVFDQTYQDFEVIVINDGSPDNTAEVLTPLVRSGRIRYVEQKNGGQASARNRGIELARGKFIALLDDDDVWPADHLAWQAELLESLPAHTGVAGTSVVIGGEVEASWQPASSLDLAPKDFINSCLTSPGQLLFRKSSLDQVGGFDEAIWGADDWDLYLRISALGPIRLEPGIALKYRVHPGNASGNYWRLFKNAQRTYRKHHHLDPKYNRLKDIWINAPTADYYRGRAAIAASQAPLGLALVHGIRSRWLGAYPSLIRLVNWTRSVRHRVWPPSRGGEA